MVTEVSTELYIEFPAEAFTTLNSSLVDPPEDRLVADAFICPDWKPEPLPVPSSSETVCSPPPDEPSPLPPSPSLPVPASEDELSSPPHAARSIESDIADARARIFPDIILISSFSLQQSQIAAHSLHETRKLT
ncbi:Flagellar motor rotation protein MotB [Marinobacter salarius]|nr:Flagellar motor rotation protein MotB [Marinobacter salarius]